MAEHKLQGKLLLVLAEAAAMHDPRVLSRWYGLDGRGSSAVGEIAGELGMTTVEVQLTHDLMLRWIWNYFTQQRGARLITVSRAD